MHRSLSPYSLSGPVRSLAISQVGQPSMPASNGSHCFGLARGSEEGADLEARCRVSCFHTSWHRMQKPQPHFLFVCVASVPQCGDLLVAFILDWSPTPLHDGSGVQKPEQLSRNQFMLINRRLQRAMEVASTMATGILENFSVPAGKGGLLACLAGFPLPTLAPSGVDQSMRALAQVLKSLQPQSEKDPPPAVRPARQSDIPMFSFVDGFITFQGSFKVRFLLGCLKGKYRGPGSFKQVFSVFSRCKHKLLRSKSSGKSSSVKDSFARVSAFTVGQCEICRNMNQDAKMRYKETLCPCSQVSGIPRSLP